jgi:hypothetical protein
MGGGTSGNQNMQLMTRTMGEEGREPEMGGGWCCRSKRNKAKNSKHYRKKRVAYGSHLGVSKCVFLFWILVNRTTSVSEANPSKISPLKGPSDEIF